MRLKNYRRLYLKLKKNWCAEIWSPPGRWVHRPLFARRDLRAKDPKQACTLRAAWRKVAAGRIPTRDEALQRAIELTEEAWAGATKSDSPVVAPDPLGQTLTGVTLGELAEQEKASSGARRGHRRATGTRIEISRALDAFVAHMETGIRPSLWRMFVGRTSRST